MGMMTDGLKQAAGQALHNILASATRTRWHALGSGALVTAMVQSSTAVTVAAIGFINAGLLGLAPALWVLFGANIGSTMTGWLVALVGAAKRAATQLWISSRRDRRQRWRRSVEVAAAALAEANGASQAAGSGAGCAAPYRGARSSSVSPNA
mgnify:CR=1 FL=1